MDFETISILVRLAWLAGASAFVLGLMRMNSPATARNGNLLSAGGMVIAIVATAVFLLARPSDAEFNSLGWLIIVVGIVIGGGAGLYSARTVKMTAMPQLVSLFNAVGGGAAALIAIDDYLGLTAAPSPQINVATVLDIVIGSITFTGSLIASGKLQGLIAGKPILIPGGRIVTIALAAVTVIGAAYLWAGNLSVPVMLRHPGRRPDLRRDDGPADRRGGHAGRDLAAQLVHRDGRGDGRVRARERRADHRRRPGRCLGRDPDQAHGRRHEPVGPQHHDRRVRWRRRASPPRPEPADPSGRSAPTTSRSSWPMPST